MDDKKEYKRKWYQAHKEEYIKKQRQWRKAHPQYMEEWRKNNSCKLKEYIKKTHSGRMEAQRKWRKNHPNYCREYIRKVRQQARDGYINKLLNCAFHTRIKYPKELIDQYRRQLLLQRKAKSLREVLDGIR